MADVLDVKRCPKCDGAVDYGYGLWGGGMGAYVFCTVGGCEFFLKQQDDEEPMPTTDKEGDRG